MSKKQLGAAQGGEKDSQSARPGWVSRLRAQPGFRTAVIAFILTVVLGVGGTAAYAWWSVTQPIPISGSTGYSLPKVAGKATCVSITLDANRVEWAPVSGAEADAVYVVRFVRENGNQAVIAVPLKSWMYPYDESVVHAALGSTGGGRVNVKVTVQTALLKTKPSGVVRIQETDIIKESDDNEELTIRYSALGSAWTAAYRCT